ncbi:MAG: hypothetical protein ACYCWE_07775 [Eubacteriales bacterium]
MVNKLLLIILFSLFTLFGCVIKNQTPEKLLLNVVADGKTEYVIIRGDIASEEEIDAAVMLRDSILNTAGVKLQIKTDWIKNESDIPASAKEILIGQTNRTESDISLDSGECVVAVSGDRIIISGSGSGSVRAAAGYFVSAFVEKDGVSVPAETDMRFTIETPASETTGTPMMEEEGDGMPLNAKIKRLNGIPRLYINDELTVPTLFFGNTDIGTNVTEQAVMAAKAGIHLHSVIYNLHFNDDYTDTESYAYINLRTCMDAILKGDPKAKIVLRVNTGAYFNTGSISEDDWRFTDRIRYTDGSSAGLASTASDIWAEEVKIRLAAIVDYMRSSPVYRDHLACIHLEKGEWFEYGFRENGSDISQVNDEKFRLWLTNIYKTDAALNTAWDVTYGLSGAQVPRDLPNNISSDHAYPNTLMLTPSEQRYVDYLDYIGDLVSGRIEDFAKTVKTASDGNLLVIAFYGYLFELSDAQSGHYDMQKLLRSEYVDGFAAPVSYDDRTGINGGAGATSAYMTVIDSVTRHGKLWFQESDQRTFINFSPDGGWLPNLNTLEDIFQVHRREVGMSMVHGNAMWAMDLMGTGWLLNQDIWDNLAALNKIYSDYIKTQTAPSSYDVVFVIDEKAESIAGMPSYNVSMNLLSRTRLEAYHAGAAIAFAEISDVADGLFDDAKLYIFMNPYRIESSEAKTLVDKLRSGGKTAVFMYGFGGLESADVKMLCGMDFTISDNGTTNMKLTAEGESKGFEKPDVRQTVTPQYSVFGGQSETYAEFSKENGASIALLDDGVLKSVFFGGTILNRQNIRALCGIAGVNILSDDNDVVIANDSLIVYCASAEGQKSLKFDKPTDVYDYFNDKSYKRVTSVEFNAVFGETYYFFLGDAAEKMKQ